ncbi:retrovirus-related Pol polyprotein from transposon 297-like Protein [Elysia marginata]|uniref:Retrovirus-related Pol polyprotein from transposon 297-like Protein n=1 Tax=Elysia marginata TaxID=1093978 RepID=A0AAV4ETM5_9GAST|nr:retrovirus-related Pol polyprotein from transposon 297-like Protein [Elysia marginata]
MMAVIYKLEKFDQYTYGQNVTIINDHKPLEQIIKKPLSQAPTRLQKLLMRAGRYDCEFRWIQGAHLCVADYLSRGCPSVKVEDDAENEVDCHLIKNSTCLPDVHMDKIKKMHPVRPDFESTD